MQKSGIFACFLFTSFPAFPYDDIDVQNNECFGAL